MARPLVSDALWELIRPLPPPPKPRRFPFPGRKPINDRKALTGIRWEDLPREMGCRSGMAYWRRLRDWQEAGVWFTLHQFLLAHLDQALRIDWSRAAVDGAFGGVEGSGRNPMDHRRPGVKQHRVVDGQGVPLATATTPANVPEVTVVAPRLDIAGPLDPTRQPVHRPKTVRADRTYDSEPHRAALRDRRIALQLARRRTPHGSGLEVFRWVVERTISWLHGFHKLRFMTDKQDEVQTALLNLVFSAHKTCNEFGIDDTETSLPGKSRIHVE